MNKQKKVKLFFSFMFCLLLLSFLSPFFSDNTIPNVPLVHASPDTLPADQDAWTENDNATYPWTVSPLYLDTIEFSTLDVKTGSWALRLLDTGDSYMAFSLDLGASTDVSSYEVFTFWFRFNNDPTYSDSIVISIGPSEWSAPYKRKYFVPIKNSWAQEVFQLSDFSDVGGVPSWADIRFIHFEIPNTPDPPVIELYIDGLAFAHLSDVTPQPVTKLPSDGDAWTENDNATYPWTVSASYPDTIEFTNTISKVASYSLKVNHTSATSYMAFSLDLTATYNLTNLDIFIFWIRVENTSNWNGGVTLAWGETAPFSGNRKRVNYLKPITTNWVKGAIPREAWVESGSPTWNSMRYLSFQIDSVSASDYTTVYLDGVHWKEWDTILSTTSVPTTMLANYDSFLQRWQKTAVYQSNQYTSTWSMVPVSGSSEGNDELESEALSQNVFGLLLAYNYSNIEYYLTFAEQYLDWLLQFQYDNSSSQADGGFYNQYNNVSKVFSGGAGTVYQGWILASLSYYYHFTPNATVKTAADKLAEFMMDVLWDDANDWFDSSFDIATETLSDATSWQDMQNGAAATGLALYYKYVTQNSTVQTILEQALYKGLTAGSPAHRFMTQQAIFEPFTYTIWGYYFASEAFNNQTYYTHALRLAKLMRANYEQNLNGSIWYEIWFLDHEEGFDGWGFACALPLLFILYDMEQDVNYRELFENALLSLVPTIQTGNYSITRKRASGDNWVNWQYTPSNAFIIAALNAYYFEIYVPSNPYLISTDKEVTYAVYSTTHNRLKFVVSTTNFAGSTSTTKVYSANKGKPTAINWIGNVSWLWDDFLNYDVTSKVATIEISHSSDEEIQIFWHQGTSYTISFLDLAGALVDYPIIQASAYIEGVLTVVVRKTVDVEKKVVMQLVMWETYTISITDGTTSYTYGDLVTTSTTSITLTLKGIEFPKETLLTYKYVRVYVTRAFATPNGNITVTYEDTLSQTNSVEIFINYRNGTNAYNATETAQSFSHTWASADNSTDYRVEINIDHQKYGTYTVRQFLPRSLSTNPWGLDFLGTSLPFATNLLIPMLIILFVGGCFSTLNAELGAFMATITAIIVVYMWSLPIPTAFLIVAFTFSICMGIIYAKRKVQT